MSFFSTTFLSSFSLIPIGRATLLLFFLYSSQGAAASSFEQLLISPKEKNKNIQPTFQKQQQLTQAVSLPVTKQNPQGILRKQYKQKSISWRSWLFPSWQKNKSYYAKIAGSLATATSIGVGVYCYHQGINPFAFKNMKKAVSATVDVVQVIPQVYNMMKSFLFPANPSRAHLAIKKLQEEGSKKALTQTLESTPPEVELSAMQVLAAGTAALGLGVVAGTTCYYMAKKRGFSNDNALLLAVIVGMLIMLISYYVITHFMKKQQQKKNQAPIAQKKEKKEASLDGKRMIKNNTTPFLFGALLVMGLVFVFWKHYNEKAIESSQLKKNPSSLITDVQTKEGNPEDLTTEEEIVPGQSEQKVNSLTSPTEEKEGATSNQYHQTSSSIGPFQKKQKDVTLHPIEAKKEDHGLLGLYYRNHKVFTTYPPLSLEQLEEKILKLDQSPYSAPSNQVKKTMPLMYGRSEDLEKKFKQFVVHCTTEKEKKVLQKEMEEYLSKDKPFSSVQAAITAWFGSEHMQKKVDIETKKKLIALKQREILDQREREFKDIEKEVEEATKDFFKGIINYFRSQVDKLYALLEQMNACASGEISGVSDSVPLIGLFDKQKKLIKKVIQEKKRLYLLLLMGKTSSEPLLQDYVAPLGQIIEIIKDIPKDISLYKKVVDLWEHDYKRLEKRLTKEAPSLEDAIAYYEEVNQLKAHYSLYNDWYNAILRANNLLDTYNEIYKEKQEALKGMYRYFTQELAAFRDFEYKYIKTFIYNHPEQQEYKSLFEIDEEEQKVRLSRKAQAEYMNTFFKTIKDAYDKALREKATDHNSSQPNKQKEERRQEQVLNHQFDSKKKEMDQLIEKGQEFPYLLLHQQRLNHALLQLGHSCKETILEKSEKEHKKLTEEDFLFFTEILKIMLFVGKLGQYYVKKYKKEKRTPDLPGQKLDLSTVPVQGKQGKDLFAFPLLFTLLPAWLSTCQKYLNRENPKQYDKVHTDAEALLKKLMVLQIKEGIEVNPLIHAYFYLMIDQLKSTLLTPISKLSFNTTYKKEIEEIKEIEQCLKGNKHFFQDKELQSAFIDTINKVVQEELKKGNSRNIKKKLKHLVDTDVESLSLSFSTQYTDVSSSTKYSLRSTQGEKSSLSLQTAPSISDRTKTPQNATVTSQKKPTWFGFW